MISPKFPAIEVIEIVNDLAKNLYMMHGEQVAEGFKFYAATTELAKRCWHAAVITYFNVALKSQGVTLEKALIPDVGSISDLVLSK